MRSALLLAVMFMVLGTCAPPPPTQPCVCGLPVTVATDRAYENTVDGTRIGFKLQTGSVVTFERDGHSVAIGFTTR
ncbi:MAG: hypothetical protein QM817_28330 [Archangium sp.]